jgi:RHS repeat-associated protein
MGSAQFITDSAGRVTYKTAYTPYGEKIADKTEGKKVIHYGYTGQEEDDNTGLMYYGARYYDPEIARFIQADTMVPDPTSSQDFNRYMYCLGNPIRYNDPTGHIGETPSGSPEGVGIGGTGGESVSCPDTSDGTSMTAEDQVNALKKEGHANVNSRYTNVLDTEKGDGEDGPTANKKGDVGDPEKGDEGKKGGDETPKGDPGGIHGGGGALGLGCAIALMIAKENIKQDLLEKKEIAKNFKKGLEIIMEDDEESEYDIGVVPWYIDLRRLPFKIVINTASAYWKIILGKSSARFIKGSTLPRNLIEQLIIKQAKANPYAGRVLRNIIMGDKRWPASKGWVKMQQVIKYRDEDVVIHYVYYTITKRFDDFKIIIE